MHSIQITANFVHFIYYLFRFFLRHYPAPVINVNSGPDSLPKTHIYTQLCAPCDLKHTLRTRAIFHTDEYALVDMCVRVLRVQLFVRSICRT